MAPKRPSRSDQPPSPASPSEEKESDFTEGEEESEEEEDESREEPKQQQKPQVKNPKKLEPEDEEEEEEESEESEGEEEEPKPTRISAPPRPKLDDESEEGSGSESDSDKTQRSPNASGFIVKPIISKPMDGASKSKKPTSKPPVSTTPPIRAAKRMAEAEKDGEDSRKKKSKVGEEDGVVEEKKFSGINRLWSLDDEIAILKGMIEYQSKKGADPYADMVAFLEFIKESVHVNVSKNQLADKIRRLKKKYLNNSSKSENGEDPVFSNPHDVKSYELSKKIWGNNNKSSKSDKVNSFAASEKEKEDGNNKARKSDKLNSSVALEKEKEDGNYKARKSDKVKSSVALEKEDGKGIVLKLALKDEVRGDQEKFWSMYPRLGESFEMQSCYLAMAVGAKNIMKEAMTSIGNAKAKQLEEKWKSLLVEEVEVYKKRLDLIQEQTKLVLDNLKSSMS